MSHDIYFHMAKEVHEDMDGAQSADRRSLLQWLFLCSQALKHNVPTLLCMKLNVW